MNWLLAVQLPVPGLSMGRIPMSSEKANTVHDLQSAIQSVRLEQARQDDALEDLREAERTRLTMLEEALAGVFDDVPESHRDLALSILPGDPPRFWVDATAYVVMARDKRTYRFVKDTRLGRTVLYEGEDVEGAADAVTRYVAERIVEKQRASEESWVIQHNRSQHKTRKRQAEPEPPRPASVLLNFLVFALGMVAGAGLLLAYAWTVIE
jgi:hypothetical protein